MKMIFSCMSDGPLISLHSNNMLWISVSSAQLQQSSPLLTPILPFPSITPILLVLLQQTKSNGLLLSLFAPQGEEKIPCSCTLLACTIRRMLSRIQLHWPDLHVCEFRSVPFTSLCFVKWFVLTMLSWSALWCPNTCTQTHTQTQTQPTLDYPYHR